MCWWLLIFSQVVKKKKELTEEQNEDLEGIMRIVDKDGVGPLYSV